MNACSVQRDGIASGAAELSHGEALAHGMSHAERLGLLFNELATMAHEATSLVAQLQCGEIRDGFGALEALCQRMGWLADASAEALGCTSVRGADPVHWFTADSHRTALQLLAQSSGQVAASAAEGRSHGTALHGEVRP